jgi:hypothetical protein
MIGINSLMCSRYPHTDTTWPRSQEVIEEHFGSISADGATRSWPATPSRCTLN